MIIRINWPLANDRPEGPASCKWSSRGTDLLQMLICHRHHPSHPCQDPDSISRTFLLNNLFLFLILHCTYSPSRFPNSAFISINHSEWHFSPLHFPSSYWHQNFPPLFSNCIIVHCSTGWWVSDLIQHFIWESQCCCLYQGDFNCSSLPAGLGENGEFERKSEEIWWNLRRFERKYLRMKSAWEEAPQLKSSCWIVWVTFAVTITYKIMTCF